MGLVELGGDLSCVGLCEFVRVDLSFWLEVGGWKFGLYYIGWKMGGGVEMFWEVG